jgi:hypothetical protein
MIGTCARFVPVSDTERESAAFCPQPASSSDFRGPVWTSPGVRHRNGGVT